MPAGSGRSEGDPVAKVNAWDRLLVRLPRLGRTTDKPPLGERLSHAFLKPANQTKAPPPKRSVDELQADKLSDDQERLVGLSLAPLAGLIAILVTVHQLADNPSAYLSDGRPNPLHVSAALAHELELVLIALALVMLVTSLLRKRLFTGMATALYGLAIFNLHWWGFGIPFVLAGAWFIVRAYRANQAWKAATAGPAGDGARAAPANRRYTPPTTSPKRLAPPKPKGARRTG